MRTLAYCLNQDDYKGCSDYRVKQIMQKPAATFTIGELSKRADIKIETIRYYEKSGIMPSPPRSSGGYRLYDDAHERRLRFIGRCRQLGFSMRDIGDLLGLLDDNRYTCADVRSLTLGHADAVQQKIRDLRRLEKALRQIASRCTGDAVPECPIIDALLDSSVQFAVRD